MKRSGKNVVSLKPKAYLDNLIFPNKKKYQWEIIKSLPAVSSKQSASNQNSMDGQ